MNVALKIIAVSPFNLFNEQPVAENGSEFSQVQPFREFTLNFKNSKWEKVSHNLLRGSLAELATRIPALITHMDFFSIESESPMRQLFPETSNPRSEEGPGTRIPETKRPFQKTAKKLHRNFYFHIFPFLEIVLARLSWDFFY